MLILLINRIRDFGPQGADAPVGLMRGMRWRLLLGRIGVCAGDSYT
jgi:hypothetical protein